MKKSEQFAMFPSHVYKDDENPHNPSSAFSNGYMTAITFLVRCGMIKDDLEYWKDMAMYESRVYNDFLSIVSKDSEETHGE